jgi:hypothetical protein
VGVKGNSGGKKGRSGRKSKAEELGLAALLDGCWTLADRKACLTALAKKAKAGDLEAVKLLMAYTYGKPVDRKELAGKDGEPIKVIVEHVRQQTTQDD